MATPDQIAANRRNAGRSTGPRTAAGKRKAAANNALRHAIIASVESDPAMGAAVARIVAALAGPLFAPAKRHGVVPLWCLLMMCFSAVDVRAACTPEQTRACKKNSPNNCVETLERRPDHTIVHKPNKACEQKNFDDCIKRCGGTAHR